MDEALFETWIGATRAVIYRLRSAQAWHGEKKTKPTERDIDLAAERAQELADALRARRPTPAVL